MSRDYFCVTKWNSPFRALKREPKVVGLVFATSHKFSEELPLWGFFSEFGTFLLSGLPAIGYQGLIWDHLLNVTGLDEDGGRTWQPKRWIFHLQQRGELPYKGTIWRNCLIWGTYLLLNSILFKSYSPTVRFCPVATLIILVVWRQFMVRWRKCWLVSEKTCERSRFPRIKGVGICALNIFRLEGIAQSSRAWH